MRFNVILVGASLLLFGLLHTGAVGGAAVEQGDTDDGLTEVPDHIVGDVTGDGDLTAADAQLIAEFAVSGDPELIETDPELADVDRNGLVRAGDAQKVAERAVGERDPAILELSGFDPTESIVPGENVTDNADVGNVGEFGTIQRAQYRLFDGDEEEFSERLEVVDLGPEENQTLDVDVEIDVTPGNYTQELRVFNENSTGETAASVTAPLFVGGAAYELTLLDDIDDGTTEGETVALDYEVENVGEDDGERDIDLEMAGQVVVTDENVTVEAGETEQLTFEDATVPATGEVDVVAGPGLSESDRTEFLAPGLVYGGEGVAVHEADEFDLSGTLGEIGDETGVTSVAISPDSSQVVLGGDSGAVLYDTGDWTAGETLTEEPVQDVAYGEVIAVATGSDVELYDTGGTLTATLTDADETVNAVAFGPGSGPIATGADDNTAYVYESFNDGADETLGDPTNDVLSVAFSPDGELAVGDADGAVFVYDDEFELQGEGPGGVTAGATDGVGSENVFDPGTTFTLDPGPDLILEEGLNASYEFGDGEHIFTDSETGDEIITLQSDENTEAALVAGIGGETVLTDRPDDDFVLDVSNPLTVDPADKATVTIQGDGLDEFSYTELDLGSEQQDLSYDLASGTAEFTFEGLDIADGAELFVEDIATGEKLDSAEIQNGAVTFTVDETGDIDATVVLDEATIEPGIAVEALSWSDDELAVGNGTDVELYDADEFELIDTLEEAADDVTDITYRDDGTRLAYAAGDSTFVHDETGDLLDELEEANDVETVVFITT